MNAMLKKLGYMLIGGIAALSIVFGVAAASAAPGGNQPPAAQPAAVQPAPAPAPVDLSTGLGNGASVLGMPRHGVNCTDVKIKVADRGALEGKVPVHTYTEPLSATTNYGETVEVSAAGVFTTTYGLSGTVRVCYGPTDDAPDYGVIGLGTKPAAAKATVEFLPGTYQYTSTVGHGEYDVNVRLTSDGTIFTITALSGTVVTARVGDVPLKVDTRASPYQVMAPENGTFYRLGAEGMLVTLHVSDDGSNVATIGIVTP